MLRLVSNCHCVALSVDIHHLLLLGRRMELSCQKEKPLTTSSIKWRRETLETTLVLLQMVKMILLVQLSSMLWNRKVGT